MGFFECCKNCKAPKRHPGCHGTCPEYLDDKKLWDTIKEAERKIKMEESGTSPAQISATRRKQRQRQRQNRKQY